VDTKKKEKGDKASREKGVSQGGGKRKRNLKWGGGGTRPRPRQQRKRGGENGGKRLAKGGNFDTRKEGEKREGRKNTKGLSIEH